MHMTLEDKFAHDIGRYECQMLKLENHLLTTCFKAFVPPIAPPNSLKDSNVNSKMKTMEGVKGMYFNSQHFRWGRGACYSFGWGLERVTSGSTIHTDLHKLNNKLVSA